MESCAVSVLALPPSLTDYQYPEAVRLIPFTKEIKKMMKNKLEHFEKTNLSSHIFAFNIQLFLTAKVLQNARCTKPTTQHAFAAYRMTIHLHSTHV